MIQVRCMNHTSEEKVWKEGELISDVPEMEITQVDDEGEYKVWTMACPTCKWHVQVIESPE